MNLEDPDARDRETKEAGLIKGVTACNRRACQDRLDSGFRWWNQSTERWYCQGCAFRINDGNGPMPDGTPLCVREDDPKLPSEAQQMRVVDDRP